MKGKRIAICIGINIYENLPELNLKYACKDAEDLHNVLGAPERGNFHSQILLDADANKNNILSHLSHILLSPDLEPDDIILFYFSGHGDRDENDNFYLYPCDAEYLDTKPRILNVEKLIYINHFENYLGNNTKAGTIIFILDACRSGAAGNLLGRIKYNYKNVIFIGACRFSEKAYEFLEIMHGRFTLSLLEAFLQIPAQKEEEWITLDEAIGFVQETIHNILPEERPQTPTFILHTTDIKIKLVKNPRYSAHAVNFIDEVKELCQDYLGVEIIEFTTNKIPDYLFKIKEVKAFGIEHITLVGCYYNVDSEIFDDEIKLFKKILTEEVLTSALIISYKDIPSFKKDIFEHFVVFLTINQVRGRLIQSNHYLLDLLQRYKNKEYDDQLYPQPLKNLYIPLSGSIINADSFKFIEQVDLRLEEWLALPECPFCILLGSYGTGKTTTAYAISYKQAELFTDEIIKSRIPFLIPLRHLFRYKNLELSQSIVDYLCDTFPKLKNLNLSVFQKMNKSGKLLLILDGLDEFGEFTEGKNNLNKEIMARNLEDISKLVETGQEKILILSRLEPFSSESVIDEKTSVLSDKWDILKMSLNPLSTTQQVLDYVDKRLLSDKEEWLKTYEALVNSEFRDIATRPVILELTIATWPKLLASKKKNVKAHLCREYINEEIGRQSKKKRQLLINKESREKLIQEVAIYLFIKAQASLSQTDLIGFIDSNRNKLQLNQDLSNEELMHDFLACSFMVAEHGMYEFAPKLLFNYFVACKLILDIEVNNFDLLKKIKLDSQTIWFINELLYDNQELIEILINRLEMKENEYTSEINGFEDKVIPISSSNSLKETGNRQRSNILLTKKIYTILDLIKNLSNHNYLEGYIFTILLLLDQNIPKNYKEYSFTELEIDNISFNSFEFLSVDFSKSKFEQTNFLDSTQCENSNFYLAKFLNLEMNTSFLRCNFRDNQFKQIVFSSIRLFNCDFTNSHFEQCIFDVEKIEECSFQNCTFVDCEFSIRNYILSSVFNLARFTNVRFFNNFKLCDFLQVKFEYSFFYQSTIEECGFSTAYYDDSVYKECKLEKCRFL